MFSRKTLLTIILAAATALAHAHSFARGDMHIGHPYARATVPGQPSGAAYLSIENNGKAADKLIAVSTPIAKSAEIHTMSMEGNVMKMREVQDIEVAPGAKIAMKPGDGYHIMLMGLKKALKKDDKFPLTLTFEKAGKVNVEVHVDGDATDMEHMDHHH
jgi:periplasmic copper chaperone A